MKDANNGALGSRNPIQFYKHSIFKDKTKYFIRMTPFECPKKLATLREITKIDIAVSTLKNMIDLLTSLNMLVCIAIV